MSLDSCIRLLVTVVCQDGNLLLNVGPKPNGEIEPAQVQRLMEIGNYLLKYGESIYSTRGGIFDVQWGGTTVTDNAIYVHVLNVPPDGIINLPPASKKIVSSGYMSDNKKVDFVQSDAEIRLTNITGKQNESDIVIKLVLH
jgi:alpha-L-fucosidase